MKSKVNVVSKKVKKSEQGVRNLSVKADKPEISKKDEFYSPHRMTPQLKRFCLLLAGSDKKLLASKLALKFGVSEQTIYIWNNLDIVKREIEQLQESMELQTKARLQLAEKPAVRTLVEITKDKKANKEVRRKSANDILGFAGRKNVNKGKVTLIQGQQQAVINKDKDKTIEQLLEEERIIDELLGDNE